MKQNLSIAYDMKRKNRKKKASGGSVQSGSPDMNYAEGGSVSASNERRPMPDNTYDDKKMAMKNSHIKAPGQDSWTDRPTEKQATMNNSRKVTKIKYPKMVPSNAFSVRLRDEEDDMQRSMSPGPYGEQPPRHDDEEGPDRQGPDTPALHMKKMAKGGMMPKDHGIEEEERMDEAHLMSMEDPSEDEGASEAHSMNEEDADKHGDDVPALHMKKMAEGGIAHEMDDQPMDEEEDEHHASIASAIMAKKDREASRMSDSDMDEMMRLYNGGEIKSHDSIYSDDSDQADLSRNADEDANEEDQLSFNSLRKENYSESEGLRELDSPMDSAQHGDDIESDKHDMVESLRRRIKAKRQF